MKKNSRSYQSSLLLACLLAAFLTVWACQDTDTRPEGWEPDSHGNDAAPAYDTVFAQDKVNTLTLTITAENWQAMLDEMTEMYGNFGEGDSGGGGPMQPPQEKRPSYALPHGRRYAVYCCAKTRGRNR